jgi:hypothetical protein
LRVFDEVGSTIKEKVIFKDAYHELQKDIHRDKVHAKVLTFMTHKILKMNRTIVKPFGVIAPSTIRHGSLVIRKRGLF